MNRCVRKIKEIHSGGMKRRRRHFQERKKDVHKMVYQNSTEENKMCKGMKNKAKTAVSKAMREKAEDPLTEIQNFQNGMLRIVNRLKTDKEIEGERCISGSYGKL